MTLSNANKTTKLVGGASLTKVNNQLGGSPNSTRRRHASAIVASTQDLQAVESVPGASAALLSTVQNVNQRSSGHVAKARAQVAAEEQRLKNE